MNMQEKVASAIKEAGIVKLIGAGTAGAVAGTALVGGAASLLKGKKKTSTAPQRVTRYAMKGQ